MLSHLILKTAHEMQVLFIWLKRKLKFSENLQKENVFLELYKSAAGSELSNLWYTFQIKWY